MRRLRSRECLLAVVCLLAAASCVEKENPLWGVGDSGSRDTTADSSGTTSSPSGVSTLSGGSTTDGIDSTSGSEPGTGSSTGAMAPSTVGPFGPPEPIPGPINTVVDEDDPTLTADRLQLIFTSDRNGNKDLFVATRSSTDDPWGEPMSLDVLNSGFADNTPMLSPDGLHMAFASERPDDGDPDLYMTSRDDWESPWTAPVPINELNSPRVDIGLSMTSDRLTAYFCAQLPSFDGQIFRARRADAGDPWITPAEELMALGSEVRDCAPFVTGDERFIVFSSDRNDAANGTSADFFWAAVEGDGFGEVTEISGVNTDQREEDAWLSPDGEWIYFSRGAIGAMDLYRARRLSE